MMSRKVNLIYFLICFFFAVLVIIPKLEESGFGFLQWPSNMLNTTNATATNNTLISKSVQINSADTKEVTDGKSVNIDLQIQPYPISKNVDSQFMITFLQPSTQTVQVHVDYDFAITKMNSEVFRASSKTGQPLLHTAEGIVKIPYKFEEPGQYSLQVSIMGINFIPIKTEQTLFDLKIS